MGTFGYFKKKYFSVLLSTFGSFLVLFFSTFGPSEDSKRGLLWGCLGRSRGIFAASLGRPLLGHTRLGLDLAKLGYTWLNLAKLGWKWLEIIEIAGNVLKWLEMAGMGGNY